MKNIIKCGIAAAVLVAAGFTAYQSYSSYGVQDNSLLMQNVEALAQSTEPEGDPSGGGYRYTNKDPRTNFCYLYVYTDAAGRVVDSSSLPNILIESGDIYMKKVIRGIYDTCPDKGFGCTPSVCHEVNY